MCLLSNKQKKKKLLGYLIGDDDTASENGSAAYKIFATHKKSYTSKNKKQTVVIVDCRRRCNDEVWINSNIL